MGFAFPVAFPVVSLLAFFVLFSVFCTGLFLIILEEGDANLSTIVLWSIVLSTIFSFLLVFTGVGLGFLPAMLLILVVISFVISHDAKKK